MALPKSYLTSTKNLGAILQALQQAKAPERFTVRFLESLDFKSTADRLIVGVLKSLGLLDDQGRPTQRYFIFLDQTQSGAVLAESIKEAYADLFAVNLNAQNLPKTDIVNKLKTLSQGAYSESVLEKMATTFQTLVKLADFSAPTARRLSETVNDDDEQGANDSDDDDNDNESHNDQQGVTKQRYRREAEITTKTLGGIHYNIQIILPESRDPQVYDALFRSLKEHLF